LLQLAQVKLAAAGVLVFPHSGITYPDFTE
jgi:hypothetical protein